MPSLARSVPKPLKVPSLARSVPKPLKVPSLARSVPKPLRVRPVPKPLKVPSLARSVPKPLKVKSHQYPSRVHPSGVPERSEASIEVFVCTTLRINGNIFKNLHMNRKIRKNSMK